MENKPVIGIHIGTTHIAVATIRNGILDMISNDQGKKRTPFYVAFNESEQLIGQSALDQAEANPQNTIYAIQDLIGRQFDDLEIRQNIKRWPFHVIKEYDQLKIEVTCKGKYQKTYRPEEILAIVLTRIMEMVEAYLGIHISEAVITCPVYFTDEQRLALKDAAKLAHLNVTQIMNEAHAAAVAYDLHLPTVQCKNVLIFHFDAVRFEVSINIKTGREFVVLANNRKNLGGKDIDQRMANHFIEEFKIEFNHEIGRDKHELHHLKMQCKRMKGVLSNASEAKFEVEGTDLTATMTRERFEELLDDLFQKTIDLVGKTLKDSGIGKKEIDEIILTGGCTRIPRIQELLSKFFNGKELKTSIDPDQCVARGAAKQAEILQKKLHK